MKSRNSYINKELSELEHLKHRPKHLDKQQPKQSHQAHEVKTLLLMSTFSRQNQLNEPANGLYWQPHFTLLASITVMPKSSSKDFLSMPFNLYFSKSKQLQSIYHISCHSYLIDNQSVNTLDASACINLSTMKGFDYPEDQKGYLRVANIFNKNHDYRLGSALIQAAIEFSFKKGFEGRVCLLSRFKSGLFYFKLGFTAKNPAIQKKLRQGKNISGGPMFLTKQAIKIWQSKISQQNIIRKSS